MSIRLLSAASLVSLMILLPIWCYSQETIPDGTTGEQLEIVKDDSIPVKWRDKRWRLFPGKYSTLKFGGGFLYEFAGYKQDAIGKQQMDSLGTPLERAFSVRDFRLVASGQFKTKRTFSWKLGAMYDGVPTIWQESISSLR